MIDCSDKSPKQNSATGQHGDLFLTSLMPWLACPPGTRTLRHPIEHKRAAGCPPQGQAREIYVTTTQQRIHVPIANEWEKSQPHGQRFIAEVLLPQALAGVLEHYVLNGDSNRANAIKGLFFRPPKPSTEHDKHTDPHFKLTCRYAGENLLEFYLRALAKYRRPWPEGSGREPTHIILPVEIKAQLMSQKKQSGSQPSTDDLDKLWNLHILASDLIPKDRGLILAIDDTALVLASDINQAFSQKPKYLKPGWSFMSAVLDVGLLIKYPQSIMILDGLGAMKETSEPSETQEFLEEQVVESRLPFMKVPLNLRKMFSNKSRRILRRSRRDGEDGLDLSAAYGNDNDKVGKELRSCYEALWKTDNLVEDIGNKDESAFTIARFDKDKETRKRLECWLERFPCGEFIFRGQSGKWPVRSSLYRSLLKIGKESCLSFVEERILTAARYISLPHTPKSEIFANLQHFGGMTNYIDFTARLTVALYFACKDNLKSDGEVFIVNPGLFPTVYPIGQVPEDCEDYSGEDRIVTMAANALNINRTVAQRNIFMRCSDGHIDFDESDRVENLSEGETKDFMVLTIKAKDKASIMSYLRRSGLIEELLFFEDIMGVIERDRRHEKPRATNEDILRKIDEYDNMEREIRGQRALLQKTSTSEPPKVSPRYSIGRIQYSRGCYGKAIDEFKLAKRREQSGEIPLQLNFYLASAYARLEEYPWALGYLTHGVKGEARNHLYHFIAADAKFKHGDYHHAWDNIKQAVTIEQASMTYLRLKILIADKLNYTDEIENCTYTYLGCCAYDPEITELREKYSCPKIKPG